MAGVTAGDNRTIIGQLAAVRMSPRVLGAAVAAASVFKLAISDGGRHQPTIVLVQVALFAVLGVLVLSRAARFLPLTRPMLGLLAAAALTTVGSVRPEASVRELLMWLLYLAIVIVTASTLTDRASMRRFMDVLVVIAGWLCLIALFMFWGAGNPGMRWYATFYWPNPFAAFLLLVLPLTLMRFVFAPRIWDALAHGLMALLLAVALVFTFSRGAWIALCVVAAFALILLRPLRWDRTLGRVAVLVALTAVSVIALAGGAPLQDTGQGIGARATSVANTADYSIQGRLHFWRAGLAIFVDHPVFGTGPGTFGSVHAAYQRDVRYYARDAHSLYIQVMAEMGVVGLAGLVVLLATVGNAWLRALRVAWAGEEYPLIAGLGLGLLAFFLHSALDMDWMFPANPAMAFALVGILAWYDSAHPAGRGGGGISPSSDRPPGPAAVWTARGSQWFRVLGVLVVLIALATTGALWAAQRHFVRGQEAATRGDWSLAAQHSAAAARWNPLSSRYLDAYAAALVRMPEPRHDRAAAALRRAMTVDRMNASLPFHLAVILTAGEPTAPGQQAETFLRRALELDRFNRPEIYRALAGLYRRQGRFDEAEQMYRTTMDLYVGRNLPQGTSLYLLLWPEVVTLFQDAANLAMIRGQVAPAARILEQLLAEDPAAVGAALQLSDLYIKLDRHADARALLEATARRVPDHPDLVKALNALH